ncbi:MAG TPA: methyltransferase domain-containing protein [Solirubrobacteraceae bacterium]|jgi:predicted nicotinamide N-methyase|nr:methyltransferase domain-containing protein [Solirubrobacteraceae bacterium]
MDLVLEVIALRDGDELRVQRPRDSEALIDEHAFEEDEFLPYWAELWPSGLALARALDGRALNGARVLELGCGLGLPSLVAARAGGRVLASDWSLGALSLLQRNASENELAVETVAADWAAPEPLTARAPFDLVLAADVLYERRSIPLLLDLLPRLGRCVWLADPGRATAEGFLRRAPETWRVRSAQADGALIHRLER